jgi:hypothetical protein
VNVNQWNARAAAETTPPNCGGKMPVLRPRLKSNDNAFGAEKGENQMLTNKIFFD